MLSVLRNYLKYQRTCIFWKCKGSLTILSNLHEILREILQFPRNFLKVFWFPFRVLLWISVSDDIFNMKIWCLNCNSVIFFENLFKFVYERKYSVYMLSMLGGNYLNRIRKFLIQPKTLVRCKPCRRTNYFKNSSAI